MVRAMADGGASSMVSTAPISTPSAPAGWRTPSSSRVGAAPAGASATGGRSPLDGSSGGAPVEHEESAESDGDRAESELGVQTHREHP